jgi:hypothetical protein
MFTCADDSCVQKTDQPFNVPDYLFGEIENNVFKDLMGMMQIPSDTAQDKQSGLR